MITFILWFWRGWRNVYTAEHVNTFARSLSANLTIPHKIVCVTDQPEGIDVETYPLWEFPDVKGWQRPQNCFFRLRLFDAEFARQFGDRIVSADIDNLILDNIDDFFTDLPDFKILSGVGSPYNGGLWSLKVGSHQEVWDEFDPSTAGERIARKRFELAVRGSALHGSDQAWLRLMLPDAPTWPQAPGWVGSFVYGLSRAPLPDWKRVQGLWIKRPEREARAMAETAFLNKYRFISFAGDRKPWSEDTRLNYPRVYEAWAKYREPVSV